MFDCSIRVTHQLNIPLEYIRVDLFSAFPWLHIICVEAIWPATSACTLFTDVFPLQQMHDCDVSDLYHSDRCECNRLS